MRILVAAAIEAGSSFAHSINTVKMAEGFARHDHAVTLLCVAPPQGPLPPSELDAHYGICRPIEWLQVPPETFGRPTSNRWLFSARALLAVRQRKCDLVYARNYVLPALCARLGVPVVGETHAHPDNPNRDLEWFLRSARRPAFKGIVTIAPILAENYAGRGAPAEKILILPDAVDERLFTRPRTLPACPFEKRRPTAVYAGHLYDYKGIPAILDAAGLRSDIDFHLVGGWPADVERAATRIRQDKLDNVVVHGMRPFSEVPAFLWHADVLLLPPSADHPSAAWTSPVKLGEYLMARRPVVCTDIPALRHWLEEDEAVFARPDDGAALAAAIGSALEDPSTSAARVNKAFRKAHDWTYTVRAGRVLAHLSGGAPAASEAAPVRPPAARGAPAIGVEPPADLAQTLARTHLVLFFTGGMSLQAWHDGGHLDREIAVYREMRPHLAGLTFVTYGDARDLRFANVLPGLNVVCNGAGLPPADYEGELQGAIMAAGRGADILCKTNQLWGGDIAARVAGRLRVPLIVRNGFLHSDFQSRRHGVESAEAREARALEGTIYAGATRIVLTTEAMRHAVMETHGIAPERISVVPNYVETEVFRPGAMAERVPGRIGFVGRLDPQKNLFTLLDAIRGLDLELVCVGAGPDASALAERVAAEGLPVSFREPVPNHALPKFLNSCSGFVMPSLYEGHPKAIMEAMSCGLPVVASDVSGLSAMLTHDVDGLLAAPTAQGLHAALARLLASEELRSRLGEAARKTIVERFALDVIAGLELAVLADVASSGVADGRAP